MKRLSWRKQPRVTRELASHLDETPLRRRRATNGLTRALRGPEPLEPRLMLATFLVTNTNNSGAGSLRAAIADANAAAGFDVINFLLAGPGPHIISPQRTNPADPLSVAMPISSPMLINGYSQAGAKPNMLSEGNDANIRIRLDGALAGAGAGGIFIDGAGATISGLSITGFEDGVVIRGGSGGNTIAGNFIGLDPLGNSVGNRGRGVTIEGSASNTVGGADPAARNVIAANGGPGVRLVRSGSVDNIIQGNYIGTDLSGTVDRGNVGHGIEVSEFSTFGSASRTMIGGLQAGAGNVISGNEGSGVAFIGAGAQFNEVLGNRIGTNVAGTAAIANSFHGVAITFSSGNAASNNFIGGVTPAARNIISGNTRAGVAMFGAGATGNAVQGNYIGTNAAGTNAIPNGNDGVRLGDSSLGAGPSGNFIGGTLPGAGNLISGNMDNGIEIAGATTIGNRIEGNLIGTNAAGNAAVPNTRIGVFVDGAANTIIGGPTVAARNVISGNSFAGVRLTKAAATGNKVEGNFIGVQMNGALPLGNQDAGVLIDSGASMNVIGGSTPAAGNVIAYSLRDGVLIESGTRNTVRLNSIHSNGGLGIDLNADDETLNDQDDADLGANNTQNGTEIVDVSVQGGIARVSGFFDGQDNTFYTLDFYVSYGNEASSVGEGQHHVLTEMIMTGASGLASFTYILPVLLPLGAIVTATVTDLEGNTSEFSHDADLDGLYDHWETDGMDVNGDGTNDLDLATLGADPLRKDLFVEVDSMPGLGPKATAIVPPGVPAQLLTHTILDGVIEAFYNSPAVNPSLSAPTGVNLHIKIDETLPLQVQWGNIDATGDWPEEFDVLKATHFGALTAAENMSPNKANILAAKARVYRYCMFADSFETTSDGELTRGTSGIGELGLQANGTALGGNDFIVTLGGWIDDMGMASFTGDDQAGTFMHELGHTLGLQHGGFESNNQYKPNYRSVMNYTWQTPFGSASVHPLRNQFIQGWRLDYSHGGLNTLDESALNEAAGIGGVSTVAVPINLVQFYNNTEALSLVSMGGAADYDQSGGAPDTMAYFLDINSDGLLRVLNDHDDWSAIRYRFDKTADAADGVHVNPEANEITFSFVSTITQLLEDLENSDSANFDEDSDVDGADFLTWQRNLGRTENATHAQGDADHDGDVDRYDLGVWQATFGHVNAQALPSAAAVAESSPADGVDLTSLAALWPEVDHHRTISRGPIPRPLSSVGTDARAIAYAQLINDRYSHDDTDVDLTAADDKRYDDEVDVALTDGPLSDRFELFSGALERPRGSTFARQSS